MQVVSLAVWPFMEQLLNFAVGFADLAIAGRLGSVVEGEGVVVAATNALAVAAYLGWLSGLMLGSVGTGATALIARAIGASHKTLANAGVGQAMTLALIMGFVGSVGVWFGGPWLAAVFIPAEDALARQFCSDYLRIFAFGLPFAAILFVGNAALRGAGDTRRPFFAMVAVNVVNLVVSISLVFGPEPIGGHSVNGIAWGTVSGFVVGGVIVLGVLISGRSAVRLRWHRMRPHWNTMRRIIKVGLPSLVEQSGMWLINAAVVKYVAWLPAQAALGAHMIGIRIEAISFMPGFALGMAAATLVGQYLGLGDPARAKRAAWYCAGTGMVTMSSMGVVFLLMPETLVRLVSPDTPEHLEMTPTLLMICGVVQPMFACYLILGSALRGAGDTRMTMILSYSSLFTLRLVGAYWLGHTLGYGLAGIWVALCADLFMKGVLYTGRFMQGGWTKIKV